MIILCSQLTRHFYFRYRSNRTCKKTWWKLKHFLVRNWKKKLTFWLNRSFSVFHSISWFHDLLWHTKCKIHFHNNFETDHNNYSVHNDNCKNNNRSPNKLQSGFSNIQILLKYRNSKQSQLVWPWTSRKIFKAFGMQALRGWVYFFDHLLSL